MATSENRGPAPLDSGPKMETQIVPGQETHDDMSYTPDEIDTDTTSDDINDLQKQVSDQYEMRRRQPGGPKPRPRRPRPRPKI